MRIEQLDLTRYGKFTGRSLAFGTARPGVPDFHLVYGPNEAGKSTLFSAVLDLLFGIEARSTYGFLHPYPTMRIGGIIEMAGKVHTLARIKRNQNTLIGPDDQPLPDGLFATALGGIDRTTYQMMFSLDDDSIEKGGEAILKSEGELGALLFSASSGLPDSSAVFAALRAQADAFYKPQGRKHCLSELKAELDALKDDKAAVDTHARDFAALRKARDSAAERHDAAVVQRAGLRVALEHARARMDGLPLLARLRRLREELAIFPDLPEAPSTWSSLTAQLMRDETEIATRLEQIEADLDRRTAEVEDIDPDARVLEAAALVRDIERSELESRYRTAARDLPSRYDDRNKVIADLAVRLAQLGRDGDDDPAALLLPAAVAARLQTLAQAKAGLNERVEAARREWVAAQEMAEAAAQVAGRLEREGDGDTPSFDAGALADQLPLLRQSDCRIRQQAARRQILTLSEAMEDGLRALAPFEGDAEQLAQQTVPLPQELAEIEAERTTAQQEIRRLDERLLEEEEAIAADTARLSHLSAHSDGPISDEAALSLLRERDTAWEKHASALDVQTADAFHTLMQRHDAMTTLRLARSEQVAQARGLALSLAERQGRLTQLRKQRQSQLILLEATDERIAGLAGQCGLPPATSLLRLSDWLARRADVLGLRDQLRTAQRDLSLAETEERDAVARLARSLGSAWPVPEALDEALALSERVLSEWRDVQMARKTAKERAQQGDVAIRARRAALDAAEKDALDWRENWTATLAGTWMAQAGQPPEPGEIVPVLAILQEIDKLLQRKGDLDHRLLAMEKDQRAFEAAVQALSARLAMPDDADPLVTFETMRNRLQQAERDDTLLRRLSDENETRRAEQAALIDRQARHEAEKNALLAHFGASSLVDVDRCLEMLKARRRVEERMTETQGDLAARLSVGTAEEAEMILAAVDEDGLRLETERMQASLAEADADAAELHAERRDADKALAAVGGDDRAAHIEEHRRTVLAEIEARALTYLRLRAGMLAAETALRLYRERHRSAMMQRASSAFSLISGGEYEGLATQADKGEEFLIARASGGGSKLARDLSKGTRFQLYLALRLAGYHEIATTRETLPFIADDIMETFDDARAGQAFRLMADMAGVGQVIYLTHHDHLCAIAKEACPDVTIHRL